MKFLNDSDSSEIIAMLVSALCIIGFIIAALFPPENNAGSSSYTSDSYYSSDYDGDDDEADELNKEDAYYFNPDEYIEEELARQEFEAVGEDYTEGYYDGYYDGLYYSYEYSYEPLQHKGGEGYFNDEWFSTSDEEATRFAAGYYTKGYEDGYYDGSNGYEEDTSFEFGTL